MARIALYSSDRRCNWRRPGGNDKPVSIQQMYYKKKFDSLKQEGRLEGYMAKKSKRLNSKFKTALKGRSAAGWDGTK